VTQRTPTRQPRTKQKKKTAHDYRTRKRSVNVYLSDAEYAALERVTAQRGCSQADLLRHLILRAERALRTDQRGSKAPTITLDPRQLVITTT
jgi:predicted DNA binding CopG/RHH family protein